MSLFDGLRRRNQNSQVWSENSCAISNMGYCQIPTSSGVQTVQSSDTATPSSLPQLPRARIATAAEVKQIRDRAATSKSMDALKATSASFEKTVSENNVTIKFERADQAFALGLGIKGGATGPDANYAEGARSGASTSCDSSTSGDYSWNMSQGSDGKVAYSLTFDKSKFNGVNLKFGNETFHISKDELTATPPPVAAVVVPPVVVTNPEPKAEVESEEELQEAAPAEPVISTPPINADSELTTAAKEIGKMFSDSLTPDGFQQAVADKALTTMLKTLLGLDDPSTRQRFVQEVKGAFTPGEGYFDSYIANNFADSGGYHIWEEQHDRTRARLITNDFPAEEAATAIYTSFGVPYVGQDWEKRPQEVAKLAYQLGRKDELEQAFLRKYNISLIDYMRAQSTDAEFKDFLSCLNSGNTATQ